MEEKEYSVVTINDIEYTELERINVDDVTYVFLSNLDNPGDFCIRKLITKNNEDFLVGLDNKDEFMNVFKLFNDKYMN